MEEERKKAEDEAKRRMVEERRAFAEARKSMVGVLVQENSRSYLGSDKNASKYFFSILKNILYTLRKVYLAFLFCSL